MGLQEWKTGEVLQVYPEKLTYDIKYTDTTVDYSIPESLVRTSLWSKRPPVSAVSCPIIPLSDEEEVIHVETASVRPDCIVIPPSSPQRRPGPDSVIAIPPPSPSPHLSKDCELGKKDSIGFCFDKENHTGSQVEVDSPRKHDRCGLELTFDDSIRRL